MNGLIYLEIAGNKIGVKFGMFAIEQLSKFEPTDSVVKMTTNTIWAGVLNYNEVKGPQLITYGDLFEYVEELLTNKDPLISQIESCFIESKAYKSLMANVPQAVESDEEKKSD